MGNFETFQILMETILTATVIGTIAPFVVPLWRMVRVIKIPQPKGRKEEF